jgi:hypothetical protein
VMGGAGPGMISDPQPVADRTGDVVVVLEVWEIGQHC